MPPDLGGGLEPLDRERSGRGLEGSACHNRVGLINGRDLFHRHVQVERQAIEVPAYLGRLAGRDENRVIPLPRRSSHFACKTGDISNPSARLQSPCQGNPLPESIFPKQGDETDSHDGPGAAAIDHGRTVSHTLNVDYAGMRHVGGPAHGVPEGEDRGELIRASWADATIVERVNMSIRPSELNRIGVGLLVPPQHFQREGAGIIRRIALGRQGWNLHHVFRTALFMPQASNQRGCKSKG